MIEKVVRIDNIGKFRKYQNEDMAWKPVTLIYGENGQGKSTLTAILHSLGGGERILEKYRTLREKKDPEVVILGEKEYCYSNGQWNELLPNIAVFDTHFINKNVYIGPNIEYEQRRNLYTLALGSQGVELADKIAELDSEIRLVNSAIKQKKDHIFVYAGRDNTLEDFIQMPAVPDIERQIAEVEKELQVLNQAKSIIQHSALVLIELPQLWLERLVHLLESNLSQVSTQAERAVHDHIKKYPTANGENWLAQGMQYMQGKTCPFCGTSAASNSLLAMYQTYFGKEYSDYKNKLVKAREWFTNQLSQKNLWQLQGKIKENRLYADFWRDYLTLEPIDDDWQSLQSIWENLHDLALREIEAKIAAPLECRNPSPQLIAAMDAYKTLENKVKDYNRSVERNNQGIENKKKDTEVANVGLMRARLVQLQNTQKRFLPEVESLCGSYARLLQDKQELNDTKQELKETLREHTLNALAGYESRLNIYFQRLGVEYRIFKVKESFVGGRPSINYCFEIADSEVAIKSNDKKAGFDTTFSNGDKTVLALAFFFERLAASSNLEQKILIFDDPVSHLDAKRQANVEKEIINIGKKARQLLVLSHNLNFLESLANRVSDVEKLQITDGGLARGW